MNYQLVNADVVRKQVAEMVAEAGSGSLSYYAYAAIIAITDAAAVQAYSGETTAVAANGLSFSYSLAAAAAEMVPGSNIERIFLKTEEAFKPPSFIFS